MMKPEKLYLELEEIIERLGYSIRKERGNFRGGYCVVEGDKLLMLNKSHPVEYQIGMLSKFLEDQDSLEDVFIKPAVRKELADRWKQKTKEVVRKNPLLQEAKTK
jgi:hypothetical protein